MRRTYLMAAILAVALGAVGTASAGNGTWTNSPTEGPSPNNDHEVSGTGCHFLLDGGSFGGGILGSEFFGGVAHVELFSQDGNTVLDDNFYSADTNGDWGGPFPIPAGLDPGTYPLKAECEPGDNRDSVNGPSQPNGLGFVYEPDRSYTVLAKKKANPAGAVVAQPALTG